MSINCAHANTILDLALSLETTKQAHKDAEKALEEAEERVRLSQSEMSQAEYEFIQAVSPSTPDEEDVQISLNQVDTNLSESPPKTKGTDKPSPIKSDNATAYATRKPSKRSKYWYWRVKSNLTDQTFVLGRVATNTVKEKMKEGVEKRNWLTIDADVLQSLDLTSEGLDMDLKRIHPRHVAPTFELPIAAVPTSQFFNIDLNNNGVPEKEDLEVALSLSLESIDGLERTITLTPRDCKPPEDIVSKGSELDGRPYRDTANGKAFRYLGKGYLSIAKRYGKGIVEIDKTGEYIANWMTEEEVDWVRQKSYEIRFLNKEKREKRKAIKARRAAQNG